MLPPRSRLQLLPLKPAHEPRHLAPNLPLFHGTDPLKTFLTETQRHRESENTEKIKGRKPMAITQFPISVITVSCDSVRKNFYQKKRTRSGPMSTFRPTTFTSTMYALDDVEPRGRSSWCGRTAARLVDALVGGRAEVVALAWSMLAAGGRSVAVEVGHALEMAASGCRAGRPWPRRRPRILSVVHQHLEESGRSSDHEARFQ